MKHWTWVNVGVAWVTVVVVAGPSPAPTGSNAPAHEARNAAAAPSAESPVEYARLDWKDGRFFLGDRPFTGVAVQRYKNGQLRARYTFQDGELHGRVEEWHPNGRRSTDSWFERGVHHGTNTYWDADGRLIKLQVWVRGELVASSEPGEAPSRITPP